MKIYTKRGDAGKTNLVGGGIVEKDDLRIRVYGGLDELNAALGLALIEIRKSFSLIESKVTVQVSLQALFENIQNELFQLGSELATPKGVKIPCELVNFGAVEALEQMIDAMESELPKLTNFILPGGSLGSAHLHLCRTVTRRVERDLASLNRMESQRAEILTYINRLSDFFFVAARFVNFKCGIEDVLWKAPRPQ